MKERNVIISLVFVLALLVIVFIKIRNEPRKKLGFNRNFSKMEYSEYALCLMDCQQITANDITHILRNGEVLSMSLDLQKQPCPFYIVRGNTKKGVSIEVFVTQCGRANKISRCYKNSDPSTCNCREEKVLKISFIKLKIDALFA
jgi:hypothetical protein